MRNDLFDQCQIKDRKLKHEINLDWANFIFFWSIKIADKIAEWHFRNKKE